MKHKKLLISTAALAVIATLSACKDSRQDSLASMNSTQNAASTTSEINTKTEAVSPSMEPSSSSASAMNKAPMDSNGSNDKQSSQADTTNAYAMGASPSGVPNSPITSDTSSTSDKTAQNMKEDKKEMKSESSTMSKQGEGKLGDASITMAVNAALAKDTDLSALKINVDTKHGNVTLTGPAPTKMAKNKATELAKSVEGVKNVHNQLTIKS